MLTIEQYQKEFIDFLKSCEIEKEPSNLYTPIKYILNLGGKRLRPVLTLLTAEIFNGNYKDALNAALAIEVFHNFTLVHDDIMDEAPLRRGEKTVHEKWDLNTGILSGDAMLIMAYQLFEVYDQEIFQELIKVFSKTALEVCEGQQYDVDFETRNDVTIEEYLKMIEYKTSVLVAAAMKIGAIVAATSLENQEAIYNFGRYLGIAFQIQDDYLDAFGDPESFGKQVGGDIIENKKTYLYLKSLEYSQNDKQVELKQFFNSKPPDSSNKIESVKKIFVESGSAKATRDAIKDYTDRAFQQLEFLDISEHKKAILMKFGVNLMNRTV